MREFLIYWMDGSTSKVRGINFEDACIRGSFNNGVFMNIDYYAELGSVVPPLRKVAGTKKHLICCCP